MTTDNERVGALAEAKSYIDPAAREKIRTEAYLDGPTDIEIFQKGLALAEEHYPHVLETMPIIAQRDFGTLIDDLKKEIKKLTPKPPKPVEKPKEEPEKEVIVESRKPLEINKPKKFKKKKKPALYEEAI